MMMIIIFIISFNSLLPPLPQPPSCALLTPPCTSPLPPPPSLPLPSAAFLPCEVVELKRQNVDINPEYSESLDSELFTVHLMFEKPTAETALAAAAEASQARTPYLHMYMDMHMLIFVHSFVFV